MTDNTKAPVRFQRANYVVTDLDRALAFYREVLGFTVEFIKDSEPDSYSYPVFSIPHTAGMRFAVLSTGDAPRCMALTEVKNIDLPAREMPRRSAIVLDIADVDGVVAGARELGLHVFDEETLITNDGRKGREIGIVDADGNLVVIYTITGRVDQ